MGRVVKNANLSRERYILNIPARPPTPSVNGHVPESVVAPHEPAPEPAPAPGTPTIDWDALRAEAAALIDEASEHAQRLIADAGREAKTLVEEAVAQADAVREAAHDAGFEAGREAGRHAAEQEMNEMLVTMRGLIDMARAERHKIIESSEHEIVKLAMGVAERIVHKQISVDPDVVVAMTKAAIARLLDREVVTVRVNPADLERMKEHREEMLALGDVKHMRIVEDQRVDRGGIVVETDSGNVDAKIRTQVEEARRLLHVEDDPVAAPAARDVVFIESDLESAASR
jgi:flagellar assembly protein FliH